MFKLSRVVICAIAVLAVGGATVALAASSPFTPKLGTPQGTAVAPGAIALHVKAADAKQVYVAIRPKKVLSHGKLKSCTNATHGCDYVEMKKWKGHTGWWIYRAADNTFTGWWTTTPGGYYWQALSFAGSPCVINATTLCEFWSKIGHFSVK
jgi:hypothetical protein